MVFCVAEHFTTSFSEPRANSFDNLCTSVGSSFQADLVGEEHLDLQLFELLPEGEVRRPLGDEFMRVELPLERLLVLVVLGVPNKGWKDLI